MTQTSTAPTHAQRSVTPVDLDSTSTAAAAHRDITAAELRPGMTLVCGDVERAITEVGRNVHGYVTITTDQHDDGSHTEVAPWFWMRVRAAAADEILDESPPCPGGDCDCQH